jgi:hypothetical protein
MFTRLSKILVFNLEDNGLNDYNKTQFVSYIHNDYKEENVINKTFSLQVNKFGDNLKVFLT